MFDVLGPVHSANRTVLDKGVNIIPLLVRFELFKSNDDY